MRPTLDKKLRDALRLALPLLRRARRVDPALYVLWSAFCTLSSARAFYGYMMKQTGGEWSAPLDDVYIHFDYARATALGHPFEWVVGNGYSSGNTSLTYPFALALGWLVGFRAQELMLWAALVAAWCVFGTLLACRPLFARPGDPAGRLMSYLVPPLLLGVGALDWSFWSGMEVAFFLGTWALALRAFFTLDGTFARSAARSTPDAPLPHGADAPSELRELKRRAWWLGAAGALMVVTRPEASTTIATFGLFAALDVRTRHGLRPAIGVLLRAGLPAIAILAVQSVANYAFTGEWSANGAIVKLAVNSPFLTTDDKVTDYVTNLKHIVNKNVDYHFTDVPAFGVIVPTLALLALAVPTVRRYALLLTLQIAGWMATVSLNGQVRWQNERYVMPAVAWLLLLAALGATALVRKRGRPAAWLVFLLGLLSVRMADELAARATDHVTHVSWLAAAGIGLVLALAMWVRPLRVVAVGAALFFFHLHQEPKMRDQKWFFGRASRNIRDQHVVAGRWLAKKNARRVLVGDAGALIYASDRPGLDIIGLGGYRALPFARAGVHGLPATLELMERVAPSERPDVLAIYPSWWGVLPTWFSTREVARFPADGNVICGGYEDVVYEADWHVLGTGERLRTMPTEDTRTVDVVDVADLVSEKEHAYVFPTPAGGWTDMKILPDPADETRDMFDGGRRIAPGRAERFVMRHLTPGRAAHLIVRSAPDGSAHVRLRVRGADVAKLQLSAVEGWVDKITEIPGDVVTRELEIEMANDGPNDFVDYHAWITQ